MLLNLIISPFNLTWFGLILFLVLVIILLRIILNKKSDKTKRIVMISIGLFNVVLWFLYKYLLYRGVPELDATGFEFKILEELPLQLCNISIFLVVIALITKNKLLCSYCFYIAVFGAFMALVAPEPGFKDTSLFSLHNIGFYGTHGIIIIEGISLVTLGFFKPKFKTIPASMLMMTLMALAIHCINLLLNNVFGATADYFYTMHLTDIGILNAFWNIIPVRFLYLIPGVLILSAYVCLVTLPFFIVNKMKEKKELD